VFCTGKKSIRFSGLFYVWLMMHVMYNTMFTATDVASKILKFLKANYMKYHVMAKLLNQVISKGFQVSSQVIVFCISFTKLNVSLITVEWWRSRARRLRDTWQPRGWICPQLRISVSLGCQACPSFTWSSLNSIRDTFSFVKEIQKRQQSSRLCHGII